jgi:hypothetical protein
VSEIDETERGGEFRGERKGSEVTRPVADHDVSWLPPRKTFVPVFVVAHVIPIKVVL